MAKKKNGTIKENPSRAEIQKNIDQTIAKIKADHIRIKGDLKKRFSK